MAVEIPVIAGDMGALEGHAAAIATGAAGIAETGAAVRASWQGLGEHYRAPEAAALLAAMEPVREVTATVGESGAAVSAALITYAGEVAGFQRRLEALRIEAGDLAALARSNDPDGDPYRIAEAGRIQAEVDRVMAEFLVAQEECAAAIRAATPGAPAGAIGAAYGWAAVAAAAVTQRGLPAAGSRMAPPPEGAPPAENARWWSSVGDPERRRILAEQPELVGNRDGIPAADRDTANRAVLERRGVEIDAEIAATQGALGVLAGPAAGFTPLSTLITAAALRRRLDGLEADRAAHRAVADTAALPERQLLLLDLEQDHPRAAVAVGDVDTAEHVAVFTPGFTSNVTDSLRGYDGDVRELRSAARRELDFNGRTNEEVAAVTWIGYDVPQVSDLGDPSGAVYSAAPAAAGGVALARFAEGIDAARGDDPHLTLVGHSYGSTTTGYALQAGTAADDAVVFGSPGLGTSDVAALDVGDGDVAVLEADDDLTADAAWFGDDPNRLDSVVGLSSRDAVAPDGRPLRGVLGHNEYLAPGSTSQYNIASTVAGLDDQRIEGPSNDRADDVRERLLEWPR